MTDHEMLAFAAKAYGAVWNPGFACFIDPAQPDSMTEGIWLPRTDDGDSLRLMVKLNLVVECMVGQSAARTFDSKFAGCVDFPAAKKDDCNRAFTHDGASATREAIFRAAVAIGQAIP